MQINYRIFNHWRELDNLPESKHFMCYQTSTGKIIALDYEGMRRLFLLNNKSDIVKANALIISELGQALEANKLSGAITLTGDF